MGKTKSNDELSHAAGGCAVGRLAARFALAFLRDRSGATAIEYGLIVSLIFLAILGSVTAFSTNATTVINTAAQAISGGI